MNLAYQVRSSNKIMQWVVANQIDVGIAMTSIEHDSIESETLCVVRANGSPHDPVGHSNYCPSPTKGP